MSGKNTNPSPVYPRPHGSFTDSEFTSSPVSAAAYIETSSTCASRPPSKVPPAEEGTKCAPTSAVRMPSPRVSALKLNTLPPFFGGAQRVTVLEPSTKNDTRAVSVFGCRSKVNAMWCH